MADNDNSSFEVRQALWNPIVRKWLKANGHAFGCSRSHCATWLELPKGDHADPGLVG